MEPIVFLIPTEHHWGEPERAPHKCEARAVGLSVCLSVRTFMT